MRDRARRQQTAELRDLGLKRVRLVRGWIAVPQRVGDPADRHGPAAVTGEQREEPRRHAPSRARHAVDDDLDRAEYPHFDVAAGRDDRPIRRRMVSSGTSVATVTDLSVRRRMCRPHPGPAGALTPDAGPPAHPNTSRTG